MALRLTRRLLVAKPPAEQGWATRDSAGPAPVGLGWIRRHARQIVEMTDKALISGDSGEQLRALIESNRLAHKIKVDAHQSFSAASGGMAHLEDYP